MAKMGAQEERRKKFETIFVRGKQIRVKRGPTVDDSALAEWLEQNADAILLKQEERYDLLEGMYAAERSESGESVETALLRHDEEIPF